MSQLSARHLETSLCMGCTAGSNSQEDECILMMGASQKYLLLNCVIQDLLIPFMENMNDS
jgi:hypothetical protein